MKTKPLVSSTILWVGVFSATCFTIVPKLRAELKTNQAALSVLGKPDFTDTVPDAASATELDQVEGLAIDPATDKLFVADYGNNRVLRFATAASYQSGAAAEAVFGQADFISDNANRGGAPAANTLNGPRGVVVDSGGRLWVSDRSNNRVLRFDGAATKASGSNADAVLGQSDFVTVTGLTSQSRMDGPNGIAVDTSGNLFVVDTTNNRVLIFYNAAAKGNGANADRVLGQANFLTNAIGTTASALSRPWGVVVDRFGILWLADVDNNRVLRYDDAATIANGAVANRVFGQANFTTSAAQPVGPASLTSPFYVAVDSNDTLWVGDYTNHRVLGYKSAAGKSSGGDADIVLGQADFVTSSLGAASAITINGANAIAVDQEGGLFVGDYVWRRITRFSGDVKIKAPSKYTAIGGKTLIRGTSEHASQVRFKQPGAPFTSAKGNVASWKAKVTGLTRPITRVRVQAVALDNRKATKIVKVLNP